MRRYGMALPLVLGGALLGSAGTAGGILCMLNSRDVSYGTVQSAPRDGIRQVRGAEAGAQLRVGPQTRVVRVARVSASEIRPGEEFIALNPPKGGASPAVLVYGKMDDLFTLYDAVGHGTKRKETPIATRR